MKRKPSASLTVSSLILRLILLVVIPALSFVLFEAGRRRLEQRRRFPLSQQLPLPLDVLPLRVHSLLLPRICKNKLMRSFLCTNCLRSNMFVPVCVLTWWGSGRRIRQSTARWKTRRAARWWSDPDAGGPACSCPDKPSSPALTTTTGRMKIHQNHSKTCEVLRHAKRKRLMQPTFSIRSFLLMVTHLLSRSL